MPRIMLCALAAALACSPGLTQAASSSSTAASSDRDDCRVIERHGDVGQAGSMSSSVTAGGGKVTGHTGGPGSTVTTRSHDGSSSSVTTGGSSGSSTVTTGSGDDCTVTVDRGRKEERK